jgi:hypothetical protein
VSGYALTGIYPPRTMQFVEKRSNANRDPDLEQVGGSKWKVDRLHPAWEVDPVCFGPERRLSPTPVKSS